MKSVNRKDFIDIGSVVKSHGTKGELRVSLTENVTLKQWAFLEFQGKPVPFYIESISGDKEEPVIKLEGIHSPVDAQRLVARTLLFPANKVKRTKASQVADVIGFKLIDETFGFIGHLESIEDLPQQTLLVTTYKGKELMIPAVEAFIVDINPEKEEVLLELPTGLLDI